jgi:Tol biopolymer transport system component
MRLAAMIAILGSAGLLVGPATEAARAEPGPIQLVSKSSSEQADFAETPALSANGRYVAFRGSIGGQVGIFRKDLVSGEIAPVVTGSASVQPQPDAAELSISADGRYVSFTTTAPLDPAADGPGSADSDVYVADMTSPPTYELASALNGSSEGLAYVGGGGSIAAGRVALSADGRKVVFVTTAASNLGGEAGDTPAGQVVLRDLASRTTTLVSAARNQSTGAMEPGVPVPNGAVATRPHLAGASLSADGSTVAWLGTDLQAQVPLLADESLATSEGYNEPLWRRIGDGPLAPTRRIVGGGDPLAAGCPAGGTLQDPACRGPFPGIATGANTIGTADCLLPPVSGWDVRAASAELVPQLSADGLGVALLGQPNGFTNVFFVDMREGLSRTQAVRQLTREVPVFAENACLATQPQLFATAGDVTSVAISPSGDRVAFATQRQQFPLSPPNLVGGPPTAMGVAELYLIDLGGETLQRLTHGTASFAEPSRRLEEFPNASGRGASSPSFDASGETLAFASSASNLVAGDGNGESGLPLSAGSDVFLVSDPRSAPTPGGASLTAPPAPIRTRPRWRLTARASSRSDGSVRLVVSVPGAGLLRAIARTDGGSQAPRTVAHAARGVPRESVAVLSLEPSRRYRGAVRSRAGLEATLDIRFAGPGGKPLTYSMQAVFRRIGNQVNRTGRDR